MGLEVAAWIGLALSAASATAQNVRANRADPKINKSALKSPSSAIEKKDDDESVSLGSDRADAKGRRKGRRQLMSPRAASTTAPSSDSTGLQI